MSAQLQKIPEEPLRQMTAQSATPADLLRLAVEQGADLDRLERLMELQSRWEAGEARKAYNAAMAAFKAKPLAIGKDKHVSFTTQKGKTEYDHATLGNVVRVIVPALAQEGLSHSWVTERIEGGRVQVTCKITHALGHSESMALDAPLDDSGGKNNIQALGSAITYLQRYTLLSMTGLATEDQDDDGKESGVKAADFITEEQEAKIRDLIEESGADKEKFLAVWKIEKISQLYKTEYDEALRLLNLKLKDKQEKAK